MGESLGSTGSVGYSVALYSNTQPMSSLMSWFAPLLVSFVVWAGVFAPWQTIVAANESSYDLPTFVVPPRQPTQVVVGTYLIGLSRVSEPAETFPTFDVEMLIDISWKDEREAFTSADLLAHTFLGEEAEEKLSEIWTPDLEIHNEIGRRETASLELIIRSDGTIEYEERFNATLHGDFDLSRFPFDSQTLDVELQSFEWDRRDLVVVQNEALTGFYPDFQTPEWFIVSTEALLGEQSEIRDDRPFSTYVFRIRAQRRAGHYLLRILMPLMFVMALTWSAFWMPVGQRFRVGFIALLTVVAFHSAIAGSLPRLHYPTFADVLLTICYVFASALIGEAIWVQRIEAAGAAERAERIDRLTRWALPIGAAGALMISVVILWY